MGYAEIIAPLTADVTQILQDLADSGESILFEGAQGSFLDIDHGTYPFVTSSNTVAAAASTGTGVGPRSLDYILGIVKAYTTRVGAGPFPTELFDEQGEHIARVGAEFGATTGRPRRCGWFDAVALRRSIVNSSVSGLCVTKLDVLDELETIQICVGYQIDGEPISGLPVVVDRFADCRPIYEEWAGWQQSTVGITDFVELPEKARAYLARIEELAGVPVDIISTGPDREQTIIKTHPFE
jgi:adenylosuccinate synthase